MLVGSRRTICSILLDGKVENGFGVSLRGTRCAALQIFHGAKVDTSQQTACIQVVRVPAENVLGLDHGFADIAGAGIKLGQGRGKDREKPDRPATRPCTLPRPGRRIPHVRWWPPSPRKCDQAGSDNKHSARSGSFALAAGVAAADGNFAAGCAAWDAGAAGAASGWVCWGAFAGA